MSPVRPWNQEGKEIAIDHLSPKDALCAQQNDSFIGAYQAEVVEPTGVQCGDAKDQKGY